MVAHILDCQVKVWEEPIETTVSNSSPIKAFVSFAAERCLPCRSLATDDFFLINYSGSQASYHSMVIMNCK
jgi:hypothetical protein